MTTLYFYDDSKLCIYDDAGDFVQQYQNENEFWNGVNKVYHALPFFN